MVSIDLKGSRMSRLSTKFVWILVLLIALQASAEAFAQQVTLHKKQAPLLEVLNSIKQQTGYFYVCQIALLNESKPVDVNVENAPLEQALAAVFKAQPLAWSIHGKTIVVRRKGTPAPSQLQDTVITTFTVMGNVKDQQGHPMPGASIAISGTQRGGQTDAAGNFLLKEVALPAVIEVRYTGFVPQRLSVINDDMLYVTLQESKQQVNEVVVTGYSSKKISELTGSLSTVKGEALKNVTSASILQNIQGKITGLNASSVGGNPAEEVNLTVRGVGSLGGTGSTQPLIVIDGLIQDAGGVANVSPNDVASVTLLKDAAATALYGARAANGVLLINTKRGGTEDGKPKVNFESVFSWEKPSFGKFRMMNSAERYDLMEQAYGNDYRNENPGATDTDVRNYLGTVMPDKQQALANNTDWVKAGYRTGQIQRYNLSVSGGAQKFKYYAGGTYHHELPVAFTDQYDKYQLRVNTEYAPSSKFTITTGFNGSFTKSRSAGLSNYQSNLYGMMPWDNPRRPDGSYKTGGPNEAGWYSGSSTYNPLYDAAWQYGFDKTYLASGDTKLQYNITPWLSVSSANRITLGFGKFGFYTDPRDSASYRPGGFYLQQASTRINYITSNMLSFNKRIGQHAIKGLAGMEFNDIRNELTSVAVRDITPGSTSIASGKVDRTGEDIQEIAFLSYLSELNYSYKDRYFLSASLRSDGSSKFGANNKFGTFYSIGAAWNISDEVFLSGNKTITNLRLRFSHGTSGNADPVGAYDIYGVYDFITYLSDQYNGQPGIIPGSQANNPDLHWEVQRMNNLGVNIALWNRLHVNIDLYDKANGSLLRAVPAAGTSGIPSVVKNIGKISNKGLEVEINSDNLKGKVNWTTNLNLSFNRNKVLYLTGVPEVFPTTGTNNLLAPGYAVGSYWGLVYKGADPETGKPSYEMIDEQGKSSVTTDISKATPQYLGNPQPKFYGGISNTVAYRGFTLSVLLDYVSGLKLFNDIRGSRYGAYEMDGASRTSNNVALPDGQTRWQQPGDHAFAPAATLVGYADASGWTTTRFLEDASYLRIRNVRLSYDMPERWLSRWKMQGATLFVSGDHLYTFTRFSGLDPESGGLSAEYASKYVINRKVSVGLSISF